MFGTVNDTAFVPAIRTRSVFTPDHEVDLHQQGLSFVAVPVNPSPFSCVGALLSRFEPFATVQFGHVTLFNFVDDAPNSGPAFGHNIGNAATPSLGISRECEAVIFQLCIAEEPRGWTAIKHLTGTHVRPIGEVKHQYYLPPGAGGIGNGRSGSGFDNSLTDFNASLKVSPRCLSSSFRSSHFPFIFSASAAVAKFC